MTIHTIHLTTPISPTFRTHQVAGLFDLSLHDLAGERFAHTLTAELPGVDEDWTIGAIVGPSGSGKTTLARAAYGEALVQPQPWPEDVALIDAIEMWNAECGVRNEGERPSGTRHSEFRTPHLKHLLRTLTAVGLASPPSWLKPYRVLSTGERFRADLARAILQMWNSEFGIWNADALSSTPHSAFRTPHLPRLLVFDEFTSTLDRIVACTASYALSKFLRSPATANLKSEICKLKFVALSCHTDFLPWLAPDWILDLDQSRSLTPSGNRSTSDHPSARSPGATAGPASSAVSSAAPVPHGVRDLLFRPDWPRAMPPPALPLAIRRIPQSAWPRFARHHYLSGGLSTAATCYGAFLDGETARRQDGEKETCDPSRYLAFSPSCRLPSPQPLATSPSPIAFCAVLATLGHRRTKHITRLVVLPEYQGLGIGPRLAEEVAAIEAAKGFRVTITASHPAVLAWCSRSPRWKYLGLKKTGSTRQTLSGRTIRCSTGRAVAAYEWIGMSESA